MKKQITKLTKQEKEKIENRLLAIFATALGAEMLCLYLFNWFRGTDGFPNAARWLCYGLLVLFIVLAVVLKLKSNKLAAQEQEMRAKKYNNWFWVCVAGAISAFFIYPTQILSIIPGIGMPMVQAINGIRLMFRDAISLRIAIVMLAVGVYTVVTFIYYGVITSKAHKASLNKGKH